MDSAQMLRVLAETVQLSDSPKARATLERIAEEIDQMQALLAAQTPGERGKRTRALISTLRSRIYTLEQALAVPSERLRLARTEARKQLVAETERSAAAGDSPARLVHRLRTLKIED